MRQLQISIAQLELAHLEPPLSRSVASKPQQTFKQQLVERYHAVCCSGKMLRCMVTGAQLSRELVKAAHILGIADHARYSYMLEGKLGMTHLDVRNGMLWAGWSGLLVACFSSLSLASTSHCLPPELVCCLHKQGRALPAVNTSYCPFLNPLRPHHPLAMQRRLRRLGPTDASCYTGTTSCSPLAWCSTCWTTPSPVSPLQTTLSLPRTAAKSKVLLACPAALARLLVSSCGMQSASHSCLPVYLTSVAFASV